MESIVVLTGAGISRESGLSTFRESAGLWEGVRPEDVATPEAFERDPALVHRFYNERRAQVQKVEPNRAHIALAEFEKRFTGSFLLVTQNVDDLHERAGSENIIHLHGQLLEARCLDTGEVFPWTEDLGLETPHPNRANRPGRLRPNVVWFGEVPFEMERIETELPHCDLFVAIGTSGVVYPAAGFVALTTPSCRRVEINKEPSQIGSFFEESFQGPATETVSEFFDSL